MATAVLTLDCDGLKICNPGKIDKIEIANSCCSFDNATIYYGNVCTVTTLTPTITINSTELIPVKGCEEVDPLEEGCECASAINFTYSMNLITTPILDFNGTFSYLDSSGEVVSSYPIDLSFFNTEHEEYQTEWRDIRVTGTFTTTQGCTIVVTFNIYTINEEETCGYFYPLDKHVSQTIIQPDNQFEIDEDDCIIIPITEDIVSYNVYIGTTLQFTGCTFLDCNELECKLTKRIQELIGKCNGCEAEYSEAMELLMFFEAINDSEVCCDKCYLLSVLLDKLDKCEKC